MSMLFLVDCIDWNEFGFLYYLFSLLVFCVSRRCDFGIYVVSGWGLFCWDVRSGVILCVALFCFHTFMFAGQFYWQIAFWLPGFDGKFRWISEHMVFMPAFQRVRVANGCLNRAFF